MSSHRARRLIILALLCLLLGSCGTQIATPIPVYLRLAGSSSMLRVMTELATAYQARHPEVTIDIQGGGTPVGLQALEAAEVDAAMASWKAPDSSAELQPQLAWHPVARDGLALVIHPRNWLSDLSLTRASEVFAGWHLSWVQLGGRGGEVEIVSREDGSGSRVTFEQSVMDSKQVTQTAVVMPSSPAVVDWIAGHPNAIGYVSMAYITTTVKALSLDGIELSTRTVERNEYPLVRTLYLVTRATPDRPISAFVEFCLSPAGQAIVHEHHGRIR